MHTLVIGLGISGKAAAAFLLKKGNSVTGVDKKVTSLPELESQGLVIKSDSQPLDIHQFDLVVTSPGIKSCHPIFKAAADANIPIIGEVELACRYIKQPVIAITGTNGKTTTTLLVTHILKTAGINAQAVGNVGVPITQQLLDSQADVWVMELSSYQLETMYAQVIDAGVILNITPDHLDRYGTMEEYAKAKMFITRCLKPNAPLYIEEKCHQEFGYLLNQHPSHTYGFSKQCALRCDGDHLLMQERIEYLLPEEYRNKGSHDVENIMASYALCRHFGITSEQMSRALKSFKKPPHRIEYVRTCKGVHYYDDSKGTNIDAVVRAVQSLEGDIFLIAGGVDKGAPYTPWIAAFNNRVRAIYAIGEAANKMADELGHAIPVKTFDTLENAVKYAASLATPGGNVLLSPGCASFDMFRDYEHRGEEYKRVVNTL